MDKAEAFEFRQCVNIIKSAGKKAKTLRDLRDILAVVSEESVFHHIYHYFLKGHVLEYTSDFAQWAGENIEERVLSEHLSNIDPYAFRNIEDLRNELLRVIDGYLEAFPEPREAMSGEEFYFNETVTLIFPAGIRARNLAEFLIALKYIDPASIYYHFYDARMRLGGGTDDFSRWLEESLGKKDLAKKIRRIDLFMHSIEGMREQMIRAVEEELRQDMEWRGIER